MSTFYFYSLSENDLLRLHIFSFCLNYGFQSLQLAVYTSSQRNKMFTFNLKNYKKKWDILCCILLKKKKAFKWFGEYVNFLTQAI